MAQYTDEDLEQVGSTLGAVLFNTIINDMDSETEGTSACLQIIAS